MHRLKTIQKEIRRLDPNIKDDDGAFQTAVVVLASQANGLKTAKDLSKFTGYPASFIRPILANLKMNGLGWRRNGKFLHSGWWDKDGTGSISFWLDVMVGQGYVQVNAKNKELAYSAK